MADSTHRERIAKGRVRSRSVKRELFCGSVGRTVLILIAGAGVLCGVGTANLASAAVVLTSASLSSELVALGPAAHIPVGAKRLGVLSSSKSVGVDIALKPRNEATLSVYANTVNEASSSNFHHFLSPSQFASYFGASRETVAGISSWLMANGLKVGSLSKNRLVLSVHASAAKVESAFHTSLTSYRLRNGKLGWAANTAPLVPRLETVSIASVVGLNNLVASTAPIKRNALKSAQPKTTAVSNVAAPHGISAVPRACAGATQAADDGGWTDADIAKAYGLTGLFDRGDVGQGQTIALFELEPFSNSDVIGFDDCYFGESHLSQVTRYPIDGFDLVGPGTGEAALDVEDLSALAPAAKIDVYEAPNTTAGDLDEYNAIISQDRANVISSSWGECEYALQLSAPGAQQVENTLFEEAAIQGETVLAASGDDGSDDCANTPFNSSKPAVPHLSVDDPGAQPFVISVGGTSLRNLRGTAGSSEVVWNDNAGGGSTGGGFSDTWPIPPWQQDSGVPGVPTSGYRAVPDISAAADEQKGITVFSKLFGGQTSGNNAVPGGWSTLGGTSSATPVWAAIFADIAASGGACSALPTTAGGTDLGFIAPELYAAASSNYAQSFHDITTGSNDVFDLGGGYSAGPGFDEASGLGSPIVTGPTGTGGLSQSLCAAASGTTTSVTRPVITYLSPAFGSVAGGTTVTITGSGFPAIGALHVSFDGVNAPVTSATATSVIVTTPQAKLGLDTASFAGAGPSLVTVTAKSTTYEATSLPAIFDYVNESATSSAVPTITGIGPSGGDSTQTKTVTIYGSGFSSSGTPTVTVGGVSALSVQVVNNYQLVVNLPPRSGATTCTVGAGFRPHTVCQTQVVVTTANGTNPLATIEPPYFGPVTFSPSGVIEAKPGTEIAPVATEYDYSTSPVITAIRPNPADPRGTEPIVIHGRGFSVSNLDWVNFGPPKQGASEQVKIIAISPTSITIDPPPNSSAVNGGQRRLRGGVSVQTSAGLSNIVPLYYAGRPTVARLSVLGAPTTSTTTLTVYGSNLAGVDKALIEDALAPTLGTAVVDSAVSKVSNSQFTVVLPEHHVGPVVIVPCTSSGCPAPTVLSELLVYFDPSSLIAEVSLHTGPKAGGASVFVFGENVAAASTVTFGNTQVAVHDAAQFPVGDRYVAEVTEPAGIAGESVPLVVHGAGVFANVPAGTFLFAANPVVIKSQEGVSGISTLR